MKQLVFFILFLTIFNSLSAKEKSEIIEDIIVSGKPLEVDLSDRGIEELWIYRNLIFARHGRRFLSPELRETFYDNQDPFGIGRYHLQINPNFTDKLLTQIDRKNIEYILNYENNINNMVLLKGVSFPSTLNKFIQIYGKPSHAKLPEPTPSPAGQWFTWDDIGNSYSLKILVDNYTKEIDEYSSVRYFLLDGSKSSSNLKLTDQIILNSSTESEIFTSFRKYGLTKSRKHQYKANIKGLWIYFDFKNGILKMISQSTFDIDMAG